MSGAQESEPDAPGLGMLLKRAEQSLLGAKGTALKPAGLTVAQYVALTELDGQPGVTGAALARACLVTPQAMMMVLKTMHEQGLIERTPHPRHSNVLEIYLTNVGREALDFARGLVEPTEQRLHDALSRGEARTFRTLLTRVINAVETEPQ